MLERNEKDLKEKVAALETQVEELRKKIITKQEFYNGMLLSGAEKGDLEIINFSLKLGADIESSNEHGNTALHLSVIHQHDEIAKTLLKKMPNLFIKINKMRLMPMDLMAEANQLENVLKFAAEPSNVDIVSAITTPVLIFAATSGLKEILISALKAGADLRGTDSLGRTALHRAVIASNLDAIELLLEQHAKTKIDIHLKDTSGQTPYDLAKKLTIKVTVKNKEKLLEIYLLEKFGAYKSEVKAQKKSLIANTAQSFLFSMTDHSVTVNNAANQPTVQKDNLVYKM